MLICCLGITSVTRLAGPFRAIDHLIPLRLNHTAHMSDNVLSLINQILPCSSINRDKNERPFATFEWSIT